MSDIDYLSAWRFWTRGKRSLEHDMKPAYFNAWKKSSMLSTIREAKSC